MFKKIKERFSKRKRLAKKQPQVLRYEELEQRVLFSADVVPGLDTAAVEEQVIVQDVTSEVQVKHEAASETVEQTAEEKRSELVFVNENVADHEQLIADLQGSDNNRVIEVVFLESDRDGIEQVSEILSERSDLTAVHVITHGADGQINLGDSWLNSTTLQQNRDAVAGWGSALTETGDILFYGCNIAAGSYGQGLLDDITELTGADVIASDDLTGSSALGGDWELEYRTGSVEASVALDAAAQAEYQGVLDVYVVSNTDATGVGSLHQAITDANANTGVTDIITFNIGGGGPQTIAVDAGGLPIITDSVILDATTQPGYSGTPLITLDGSATPASSGINGINLRANDCTVKGFIVINFADEGIEMDGSTGFGDNNIIQNNWVGIDAVGNVAGNAEHGIMISADASGNQIGGTGPNEGNVVAGNGFSGVIINENSDNNIVEGNIIGLKVDGTTPAGNGGHGVLIELSSDGNRIGGTAANAGNVISGNTLSGIYIDGTTDATYTTAVTNTLVQGNFIGTDITGTLDRGNTQKGVQIVSGATNNTIGGTTAGHRNVISGNSGDGIEINGSDGNTIAGNYIGTDVSGTLDLGNGDEGVEVNSANNTIGGTTAATRNIISGNADDGLLITGAGAIGNIVLGNYIGLDINGAALSNGANGIAIKNGASDNSIGGTANGAENVISGNTSNGIVLRDSGTTDNRIEGNYIGTDPTGTIARANVDGIQITGGASDNTIGGLTSDHQNIISGNSSDGIFISDAGTTGNALLGNAVYANTGLGIDLTASGNNDQSYAVLASAGTNGADSVTISGSLSSAASTTYRIEFFASTTADGSGYGEAERYLGATSVTTDGSGDATINANLSALVASGEFVTATATVDLGGGNYGDTSEFALNVAAAVNDAPVQVNNTGSTVTEGGTDTITNTELRYDDSEQPASSVIYTVTSGLANGQLELTTDPGMAVTFFTQDDIDNNRLVYVHDDSETTSDSFNFTVDDGQGNSVTGQYFAITVTPVNDAAPVATDDTYSVDEDNTLTAEWWNTAWTRRQELTFDNAAQAETLSDFPVLVILNSSNIDYAQTNDDGSDLRFFTSDGTQLAYEIDQWNEGSDSSVWVRVPQITGSSDSDGIWMYYGNAAAEPGQDLAAVWDNNFVGVWHLGEEQAGTGTGGIYQDSTSYNHHGVDHVAATAQDGQVTDGQDFGANDWIEVDHDASLDLTDSMTISFWIKQDSDSGTFNRVVEKGLWGYGSSYYFGGGNGTNDLTFYLNGQEVIDTVDNVLAVGEWQHAAVSYTSNGDGSGTARLYLNGTEIATGDYTGGAVPGNTGRLAIGHSDPDYDFDGSIDEVQISDTGRSADWIAAQYQATKNQFGAEFVQFGGAESAPAVGGVLSNDTDVDGDPLTVTLVDGPDNAQSFTLNKDGTFTYTPSADYIGSDTFTYEVSDGNGGTTQATATITVNPINDAPDFSLTLDGTPTFTEDGPAVVLDSNVAILDAELSATDNFDGATLTLVRNGGAVSDDVFSATGNLSALTEGGGLVIGGNTIGAVTTNSTGTLVLTFNANATNVLVDQAMQQIAYSNTSHVPPASVQIDWTFDDGNIGAQGTGGVLQALGSTTVNITNVAPVFSATGAATVNEGEIYTLNLSSNDPVDTWTINWGDGTVDTIAGNLTSATHVYNVGGLTNNITISATDATGTFYDSKLIIGNAASGTDGFLLMAGFDPDTGLADIASAQILNTPTPSDLDWAADVVVGPNGDIYATGYESGNVVRFDGTTGAFVEEFVTTTQPVSIAFGPDGNLYVASNLGHVKRFDGTTGAYIDDFLTLTYIPEEMTFGADGNLYVGQYNPGRIYRYDGDTGAPLDGGAAFIDPEVTGTTADDINYSEQFAFGPDGNIYIASLADGKIQRYDGTTGAFIDTFATPGLTGAGWPNGPTGVAFGPDGHLYVTTVDRVERYDGTTGAYIDDYIPVGAGLDNPWFSSFTPNHQVTVISAAPTQVNNTGSTVTEGGTDTITSSELRYDDSEQPASSVTYTVTGGLANGQLELTGNPGVAITSFTQAQIDAGQVVYVHDGSNTISDSFNFSVDDGQGNTLAGQSFALTIIAVDDDAPTQVNNTGSTVTEGGTDTLTNTELRYDDSEQPASSVTYTVTGGLANGQLELTGNPGVAITSFTQAQINAGEVVYVHDDSNTTSDSFNFSVDDGQGNTLAGQTFNLTVTAVDDDSPVQVNNAGSTAVEGGSDTLITAELLYTDSEQPASSVTYTVTGGLANGQLELTGNPGVAVTSFTQAQIDAGEVVYVHDGSNTISDNFNFSVDDGQGNTLGGQSFSITVTAVDGDAPAQVNNTGSTVTEGGTDTIISGELLYTDSEQPASSVMYTVTGGLANGQLELTGNPGVAITSFTQAQIDSGEVVYVHDGSNTISDNFNFSVDDGQGNVLAGQTFSLTITAVDDDAPVQVNNTGSTVTEGGTDTLTNTELRYDDSEQPASSVTYTVTGGLANGQLELTGNPGVAITSFTQAQINAGEVVYVHDDSNTTSDSFNFSVDDGQGNTLAGQTFNLTVTAVDDDSPVQVNNAGSTAVEGGSDTLITAELLYTDSEQPASSVTYTVTGGLANGQLELTGNPGAAVTSFTQAQVDSGEVVYVHDGSNTISDNFNFSVDDGQGNVLAGQTFSLTITAVDDDAPVQVNNTGSTVTEGGTDTLTNTELRYDDSEQPASSVTYTVTGGLANGQLELTGNPGVAITSFTQAQINAGEVVYVHDDSNTTSDSFNFSVDDGQGNTLAGQTFNLTVTAVDDDSPVQVNNAGSTAVEGGSDTLITAELLYTDSEQPASSVTYTVTGGLANGQLELTGNPGVAVTSFTQAQIDAGEVVYVHDGSNTISDNFNFSVDDGQGNTLGGQSFSITVTAVDGDAPAQVNNTGSTVTEGGTDTIISGELLYTDSEQPASSVMYTVTGGLANGQLELTGNPGVAITSFTQAQIDSGEVVYVHDGSNTISDNFNFSVDDGQGNVLAGQTFSLTITAVDDDAPVQVNNTGSTVTEGGTDTLTNTELRYDDSEQPASSVTYTVTGGLANGQLELTGNPGVAITSFTQAQINAGEVVYVHDDSNTTSDSFNFSVDDGQGNTLAGQTFNLTVTAVDDDSPVQVNNAGSTAVEGGSDTLITAELLYTDSEQPASSVTYTVTGGLANGQLELTGNPGVAVTSFTQAQIDAGEVVYVHDGSNTISDNFNFSVDDGQGNTLGGQSFSITVTAVDGDAPAQVNNTGSTVTEGGTDTIISGELLYTDSEQPASSVMYTVTGGLANGQLELTGNPGVAVTSFTQAQINAGEVVYVHDDSNTTSDSFNFSVDDGQGNTLAGQTFNLTITPVNDTPVINNATFALDENSTNGTAVGTVPVTDPDTGDTHVYSITAGNTGGAFVIDNAGNISVANSAALDFETTPVFTLTVQIQDQGGTGLIDTATITVNLNDLNEAPISSGIANVTVNEDTPNTVIDLFAAFADSEDADASLTYTITANTNQGLFAATLIDGVAGTLTLDYAPNANGTANITIRATDTSALWVASTFTVTVNPANDAPSTTPVTLTAISEDGGSRFITQAELLANATDVDGPALTATNLAISAGSGTLVDNGGGTWNYTPAANDDTSVSFTYTVTDGSLTAAGSATLDITPVNDAPVTNNDFATVDEGRNVVINLVGNDADVENALDLSSITITAAPTNGTLVDNGDGTLTYGHDGSKTISDRFSYTINDVSGATSNIAAVSLTVIPSNDNDPSDSTDPDPILLEDPVTDDDEDSDVESPIYEAPVEDPLIADEVVSPVEAVQTPEYSGDTNESIVEIKDSQDEESQDIIYLTDELDRSTQSEGREDDRGYTYYDNDLYEDMSSLKYWNLIDNAAQSGPVAVNLDDVSFLDFDSEDNDPVIIDEDYDVLRQEIDESFNTELKSQGIKAKIVTVTATTFTVGIVSYLLRAGSLVASMMSALPLWRGFDPIAIFSGNKKKKKNQNEISDTGELKPEAFFDGDAE